MRHLGLHDWLRIDVTDDLDLVGPVAAPLLRRFGPLWPPNSHFGGLLAAHARGGTFVTGVGGDELFEPSGQPAARALLSGGWPRPGDDPCDSGVRSYLVSCASGVREAG